MKKSWNRTASYLAVSLNKWRNCWNESSGQIRRKSTRNHICKKNEEICQMKEFPKIKEIPKLKNGWKREVFHVFLRYVLDLQGRKTQGKACKSTSFCKSTRNHMCKKMKKFVKWKRFLDSAQKHKKVGISRNEGIPSFIYHVKKMKKSTDSWIFSQNTKNWNLW